MKLHCYAHSHVMGTCVRTLRTHTHAHTGIHLEKCYTDAGETEGDENGKKNGATLDMSFPRRFHARTPSHQEDVQGAPEPFRMQPGEALRLVSSTIQMKSNQVNIQEHASTRHGMNRLTAGCDLHPPSSSMLVGRCVSYSGLSE